MLNSSRPPNTQVSRDNINFQVRRLSIWRRKESSAQNYCSNHNYGVIKTLMEFISLLMIASLSAIMISEEIYSRILYSLVVAQCSTAWKTEWKKKSRHSLHHQWVQKLRRLLIENIHVGSEELSCHSSRSLSRCGSPKRNSMNTDQV